MVVAEAGEKKEKKQKERRPGSRSRSGEVALAGADAGAKKEW